MKFQYTPIAAQAEAERSVLYTQITNLDGEIDELKCKAKRLLDKEDFSQVMETAQTLCKLEESRSLKWAHRVALSAVVTAGSTQIEEEGDFA